MVKGLCAMAVCAITTSSKKAKSACKSQTFIQLTTDILDTMFVSKKNLATLNMFSLNISREF